MSTVVGTKTSGHYQWRDGCRGWHLVQQDNLSVIQERVPPGKSERLHYHKKSRQFFYVLDGANLASGLYFVRLQSGNEVATKKMIFLK